MVLARQRCNTRCTDRTRGEVVRPEGLEPPAYWFEASRSIQLSYGRIASSYHPRRARFQRDSMVPNKTADGESSTISYASSYASAKLQARPVPRRSKFHAP